MRILHVTKKYPNAIGGDASVVYNLEKQQKKHGHKVSILTTNCNDILDKKNIIKFGLKDNSSNLDHINIKRLISLLILLFSSFYYIRDVKPDVVHAHSIDLGLALYFACKFYKVPIVYTAHCGLFSKNNNYPVRGFIERIVFKFIKFNKIITVNQNDLKYVADKNRYKYIPNGIDLDTFQFNSKERGNICLYVGRLEEYKGIMFLIKSIRILVEKKINVNLLIIGKGPQSKNLKQFVTKHNLEKAVTFLESINQTKMSEYYNKALVTILPSYKIEGFGLVLLESMACGTPVITTNIVGLSNEIFKHKTGLIVKVKSSKSIAKAIALLIKNKKATKLMRYNARKLVENKYNWTTISKMIEEVY